jgi:hypothetical protein
MLERLRKLTEQHCVIRQTLRMPPQASATLRRRAA